MPSTKKVTKFIEDYVMTLEGDFSKRQINEKFPGHNSCVRDALILLCEKNLIAHIGYGMYSRKLNTEDSAYRSKTRMVIDYINTKDIFSIKDVYNFFNETILKSQICNTVKLLLDEGKIKKIAWGKYKKIKA